jgi:hypothetical protein
MFLTWIRRRVAVAFGTFSFLVAFAPSGFAQASPPPAHAGKANWELANRFSTEALRRATYSSTVTPHFIGKTDSVWYNWKDRNGSTFFLVVPLTKTKKPLFDHTKLAAALATAHHKPYDPNTLPFTTLIFTKDHKRFRFNVDTGAAASRYEWNLAAETITRLGRPLRADSIPPDEEREEGGGRGGRGGGGGGGGAMQTGDFHNWSPDSSMFVFARDHDLYLVEKGKTDTVKISTDGEKNRSFGFRDTTVVIDTTQQQDDTQGGGRGGRGNRDPRVRPNVIWSPDSRAFTIVRQDQRKVKELYLVNVLAEPRPTLTSYAYSMPGESNVAQAELYIWKKGDATVSPVSLKKWRDQHLLNPHWTTGHEKLRLVRRDRPQRHLELIEVDLATNAIKTLITESVENANLEAPQVRYVKGDGDIIWWSERSGWGHYYLYDHNGNLKKALTEGAWRADEIPAIDSVAGVIWVSGVGREPGENVYYRHTYRMNADGSGFALVDAGNSNHVATFSPTKKYFIDNFSRIEQAPKAVLRDATGKAVMDLEEMDLSSLKALGWKPPEEFIVKAADGVTDIYGNMWKPFDFDSTRKYPIIANVYPGPQRRAAAAGAARLHRHPDRQPRRKPAPLERVPELQLLQPPRLRARRQEGGDRAARRAPQMDRHRTRGDLRPLGRRIPHGRGDDAPAVQRFLQGRRVVFGQSRQQHLQPELERAVLRAQDGREIERGQRAQSARDEWRQSGELRGGGGYRLRGRLARVRDPRPDERRAGAEPEGPAAAHHGRHGQQRSPGEHHPARERAHQGEQALRLHADAGEAARVR